MFALSRATHLTPLSIMASLPALGGNCRRVLDVGMGTGRNSLFMARQGIHVDALDRSVAAVADLNAYAITHALPVSARVHDISKVDPAFCEYDLVLFTLVLHYLTCMRASSMLQTARKQARPGTLHVLAAITKSGDFAAGTSHRRHYYPATDELCRIYSDGGWELYNAYEEQLAMRQSRPDGSPMFNLVAFLVARKPTR